MLSKKNILSLFTLIASAHFVACTYKPTDQNDDHIIGNSVQTVSALRSADGSEAKNIVIFDETVRRIHQFNVTDMTFVRSFAVSNPAEKHYVLYSDLGNYTIDLTSKGLTIFNKYGQANKDPITFQGTPISAAFRPELNLLVVYDDLMSIGILKLDSNGEVIQSWVGGSDIINDLSSSAGDLTETGFLSLALSDGSIAVVDVNQSLASRSWVLVAGTPFATTLSNIKWVAPIAGHPEQLLAESSQSLALINTSTHTILSSFDLTGFHVDKVSKIIDPHLFLRGSDGETFKLVYVEGSQVKAKTFYPRDNVFFSANHILTSTLDLAKNTWSFVDTNYSQPGLFDDINEIRENRTYKSYRMSDKLAISKLPVASQVQVQLAEKFIFALHPSEIGYATRTDVNSGEEIPARYFNIPYISK